VPEYLDFQLFQPKAHLTNIVQGVWSTSVDLHSPHNIKRWLHSDACSGILFNLGGSIQLNGTPFYEGCILQPVSKQAQEITLSPGSMVVGIRFHPAMSFAVLGSIYQQATAIMQAQGNLLEFNNLGEQLKKSLGHYARIVVLYRWFNSILPLVDKLPIALTSALQALENKRSPGELSKQVPLSQRQIERQFQKWLDMTPKYYQRISRVKEALKKLKCKPTTELADLAIDIGFSDQAHMTREFNYIARITPKQYAQQVINDKKKIS
jgi:AraC-like DNA-binding protein